MQLSYASTAGSRRAAVVSTGIKWAIVLLVILNLLQLNLLYFSSQGSTRCVLKAALATRSTSHTATARSKSDTAAATTLPGNPLGSTGASMVSQPQATRRGRYALFVLYSWNYDALLTAARSYGKAGFSSDLIILDNTINSTLADDPVIAELAAEVMPTRTRLTFSQAQNFMADVAIERGYEYYFWGHADVAIAGKDESASLADELRACAESAFKSHPKWGIISVNSSFFSAVRTDVMREVKYDTFVTVYLSHCDFYPRVRAASFETLDSSQICPSVTVNAQAIDIPMAAPHISREERSEERPREEVSQARRALLGVPGGMGSMGSFHFDWDMDAMPAGDRVGWELWEQASYLYLLAKWGPGGDGENACAIEVQDPISGNVSLPQKPFSSLPYLQRHWYEEDPHFQNIPILAGLGERTKRKEPEWAKQALAEADLAAKEKAQASGDKEVFESAAAAEAAAGAAGVAGAAAAAVNAAESEPDEDAAGGASTERLASAELGTLKTAGKAGQASADSDGIDAAAAAAEQEGDDAAGDFDGFDALDEEGLDDYPEAVDEEMKPLAELNSLEAAADNGEEALGDLEGFEAADGDEEALADLEAAEAEHGLTEQEGFDEDADAELALSDPTRLHPIEALEYLEPGQDVEIIAEEDSAAAAEAREAAELASDGAARMADSEAVTDADAASSSAAALQLPLKADQPSDGSLAQTAKAGVGSAAAGKESQDQPSSVERYEADLASEDASFLEEDPDLPLAGGAAEEQEGWPEEDWYAGEEEDFETVGADELWIDQSHLADEPEGETEDEASASGAADQIAEETAEQEQAGLPEGMAEAVALLEKGEVSSEPAVLTEEADSAGRMQEESLSQPGASSERGDTAQQESAASRITEQAAALSEVDVTDSIVEGDREGGKLVGSDGGAVSADDSDEEELLDVDYLLEEEEEGAEIDGLDAMDGEDEESGADSALLNEKPDDLLAHEDV